ncbi:MAG: cupin domain-containing protein [Nitrospiraceae bacterium]|nr:cupin domain-containing protein [Nitrospiraceae bacterium]
MKQEKTMPLVLDLKKLIKFHPEKISREMIAETPEMRIALMCLEPGQELAPHKAPLRLMMYCVEGRGTFTAGGEEIDADEKTAIVCDPMVEHGFKASKGVRLVVLAVVTPAEMQ